MEPRRRDPAQKQASVSRGLSRVLSGFGIDEPAMSQRVPGLCRGECLQGWEVTVEDVLGESRPGDRWAEASSVPSGVCLGCSYMSGPPSKLPVSPVWPAS